MKPNLSSRWAASVAGARGMFNLNDPRWGRGEGQSGNEEQPPEQPRPPTPPPPPPPSDPTPIRPRPQGNRNAGPPDLDELWRDFNRKLGGLFGGGGGGRGSGRTRWRRWRIPARHEECRRGRRPDRRDRAVDLAVHRLLHRAGGPAGRHHTLRSISIDRRRGPPLAAAVPDRAARARLRHADPLGRRRPRQRDQGDRSEGLCDADRRTRTSSRSSSPCSTG